jgi:hypothetical protein
MMGNTTQKDIRLAATAVLCGIAGTNHSMVCSCYVQCQVGIWALPGLLLLLLL